LGTWNAATNTPTLVNGTGDAGDMYICNVAGTVNFGAGPVTFAVGDWVLYGSGTWQKSNGQNGTVTSVAVTESGDALTITGSPITTAGTINIGFAGTSGQYVNGAGGLTTFPSLAGYVTSVTATAPLLSSGGTTPDLSIPAASSTVDGYLDNADWTTFNNKQNAITLTTTGTSGVSTLIGSTLNIPNYSTDLSGYVPYTGATANVNLGTFDLTADVITGATGSFASSGGSNTFAINHSSGSGIALNITKGGNGEGLYINKTSGTGNAATIIGTLNATTLVKSGGTSSQFLKADGSVDSSAYITLTSLSGGTGITYNNTTGVITNSAPDQTVSLTQGAGISISGTYPSFTIASTITQYTDALARAAISLTTTGTSGAATYNSTTGVLNVPNYAPDLSGYVPTSRTITINGTSFDLSANRSYSVGTVTSVGLSSSTSGVTIGSTPITTSGTITLAIATASGSQNGLLSSTDWTTFNNKQSALTNPVTGTGTTNYLPKFTGASTIGNSAITDDGTTVTLVSRALSGTSATFSSSVTARQTITIDRYGDGTETGVFSNSTGNLVINATGGNNIKFQGNGTDRLYLSNSGNLGLGVTPSAWMSGSTALQVVRGGLWHDGSGYLAMFNNAYYDGSNWRYIASTTATVYNQVNGTNQWSTAPSGTAGNAISFTQAMTLLANGNLGLGTTSPASKFQIGSVGSTGYSVSNGLAIGNGTQASALDVDASGLNIYSTNNIIFYPNTTERMRITSGGNVLIGTTTDAGYKLDVNGTGRFSGSGSNGYLYVSGNAGTGGSTNPAYVQGMNFSWNKSNGGGESLLTYTNQGGGSNIRFGIGYWNNTTYSEQFTIASTGAATFTTSSTNCSIAINNTSNTPYIRFDESGAAKFFIGQRNSVSGDGGTGYDLLTVAGNDLRFFAGNTKALTLATTGAATFSSFVTASYFKAISGATYSEYIYDGMYSTGTDQYISTGGAYNTRFLTNGSERMRITSGGNVLINTTTDAGYELYVNGGSTNGALFYSTSAANQIKAAGTAPAITFTNTITSPTIGGALGAATTANQFITGTAAGDVILLNQYSGNRLYVTSFSGGVYLTSGATSWTANSDIRLKNINSHIENAVEKLSTLQTINFCYKNDKTNKQNLGLIAQEVEKIFPELIDKDGEDMLGVRYTELVPVLIKAIQELKAEIDELKIKNK
jgi:hypothetical protein